MTCVDGHAGLIWILATNEDGWHCVNCDTRPGEPPGYSPQHDRSHLRAKVWSIIHALADHGFIHVSNSGHGEGLADAVTAAVERPGNLDQYSIVASIMRRETPSHAAFWRNVGRGIVAGKDDRERCPCGALATSWQGGGGRPARNRCGDHAAGWDDNETDDQLRERLSKEQDRG